MLYLAQLYFLFFSFKVHYNMSEERKSFEVLGEPIKYEPAPLLERESSYIETKCGKAFVIREGKPTKYSILTLHDIGLNSTFNFSSIV